MFSNETLAQNCPVTVSPNPANICPSGNIKLTASASGASNFTWSPAAGLSGTMGTSVTANPAVTTTYTVTAVGCTGSATVVVKMNTNPVASFSFSPSSGCAGNPIQFTNSSSPSAGLSYAWNFGDPLSGTANSDTLENPTHVFSAFGTGNQTFTVTLTVTTSAGCKNTSSQTITLTKGPDASIADQNTFTPFTFCQTGSGTNFILVINNASTSQATNTNYDIDWGDGTPHYSGATLPNGTTHTYTSLGYFTITVTVDGVNGCSTTKKYTVFNGSNPSVGLGTLGATVNLCGPVTLTFPFNNTSGNSPGTKYTVTFSDGGTQTFMHPPPASITHTFSKSSCGYSSPNYSNSFFVKIQASNPCGSSTSTVEPIQVGTPPTANIGISPVSLSGCVNTTTFSFSNSSSNNNYIFNGNCTSSMTSVWSITPATNWTVTSGSLSSNSFNATFSQSGTYTIKLISSNPCGSDTFLRDICVIPPPVADFSFTPPNCAPAIVNFTNNSNSLNLCGNATYLWTITPSTGWSFTGGTNATSINPSVQFNTSDSFTVKLRVTNPCTYNEISKSFKIKSTPVVTLNPILNVCGNPAVISPTATFNAGGGTITSYSWSFAGGNPASSNSQVPGNISYLSNGTYTVTVTATNECSSSTDTKTFTVSPTLTADAGTDDSLCTGSSITLNGNGTGGTPNYTYKWSPATGLYYSFSKNPSASPVTTTTYTLTVTDSKGCTAADDVIVKVNPTPNVSASANPSSICPGGNSTLTATGADSYIWSPSATLSATTGSAVTATPNSYTNYVVTGTSVNGCTKQANVAVSVNTSATISVSPSNTGICDGNTATLNASGGISYSWSPATGLSATTGSSVTANPTNSVTYTVTGFSGNGCSGTATANINVVTLPVVSGVATKYTLCTGDSAILSVSGANDYTWTPSTGLSSVTGSNITASPAVTTTYTVTGTSGLNCQDDDTVVISVFPYPVVTVNPAKPEICKGQSVNITASGADTYVWSPVTGLNISTGSAVTANPSASLTYTLTGTSMNGCSVSVNIPVTVSSLLTVDAGTDWNVCSIAQPVIMSGFTPQGGLWNGPGIANASQAVFEPAIAGVGTHKLFYTVVNAGNCTSTDSVNITVLATATANAGNDILSCLNAPPFNLTGFTPSGGTWSGAGITDAALGTVNPVMAGLGQHKLVYSPSPAQCYTKDSIILTVNSAPVVTVLPAVSPVCAGQSANLTATGGTSYTWSPAASLNVSTGADVIASPALTTTYTVTTTDGNNCTASATNIVVFNPLPEILITPATASICNGGNVSMVASGADTYVWSPTTGLNTSTGSAVNANVTYTTDYTVIGTDSNGCVNMKSATVTVHALPQVQVNPENTIICNGQSVTLTASNANSFTWSPVTGLSSTSGNSVTASPAATTTYSVIGTDANGCSGAAQSVVTVNIPAVSFNNPNPVTCRGTAVNITATGANTYSWSPLTGLSSGTGNTISASPPVTTTYTVIGTDANGCTGVFNLTVLVHAPYLTVTPSSDEICSGQSTGFTTGGSAVSYAWSPSTALSSTSAGSVTANPEASITYTVIGTDQFNCSDTVQAAVTVFLQPAAGFSFMPVSGCDPVTVLFNDESVAALSWQWIFSDGGSSSEQNPVHTFNGDGIYTVTQYVEGEGGCNDEITQSDSITVYPEPLAAFDYLQSSSPSSGEVQFANASLNADAYHWDFGDGDTSNTFSPVHTYLESGTYTVTLISSNQYGCTDTIITEVVVSYFKNLFIPAAFSPNGDGINDVFTVYGKGIDSYSMHIFDRWGNSVYADEGNTAAWDGTYKGKILNPAVFVYLIRIKYIDGTMQKMKGDVTLVR